MDPNVCYLAMLEAFALGDLETARDRAESLGDWFFSRRVSASRQYRRRDRYPNRPLKVRHKGVTGRFFFPKHIVAWANSFVPPFKKDISHETRRSA